MKLLDDDRDALRALEDGVYMEVDTGRYTRYTVDDYAPQITASSLRRLVKLGLAHVQTINVSHWGGYEEWDREHALKNGPHVMATLTEQGYDVQEAINDELDREMMETYHMVSGAHRKFCRNIGTSTELCESCR